MVLCKGDSALNPVIMAQPFIRRDSCFWKAFGFLGRFVRICEFLSGNLSGVLFTFSEVNFGRWDKFEASDDNVSLCDSLRWAMHGEDERCHGSCAMQFADM